jgi:hypothetical protein
MGANDDTTREDAPCRESPCRRPTYNPANPALGYDRTSVADINTASRFVGCRPP